MKKYKIRSVVKRGFRYRRKDPPKVEKACEKLISKGVENLKDAELLAILLRTGRKGKSAIQTAKQILKKYSKKKLLGLNYEDLVKIKGIGPAKASTILAAAELTKRAQIKRASREGAPREIASREKEETIPLIKSISTKLFGSILELFMEKQKPKKWGTKIKLIQIALIIFGIMGSASFMQFILEEAIQMHSFGLYPILSNKNIEVAEKVRVVDGHKEFCERISPLMDGLSIVNPITGIFYKKFMVATFGKIENDYRSIYGVAPSELDEIELNCGQAIVGQKCVMEGEIYKIKTDENYTVFILGKDKQVYAPYPIGEMKEIYHLLRMPVEGDIIKVIGRKAVYKGTPEVKLGYLTITVYSKIGNEKLP